MEFWGRRGKHPSLRTGGERQVETNGERLKSVEKALTLGIPPQDDKSLCLKERVWKQYAIYYLVVDDKYLEQVDEFVWRWVHW